MTNLSLRIGEGHWRSSFTAPSSWNTTLLIGQERASARQGDGLPAPVDFPETLNEHLRPAVIKIRDWIKRPPRLARFDPDALREPSELVPEPEIETFFVNRGRGLPGVYDLILNRGDSSFHEIAEKVKTLFPSIARIGLRAVNRTYKELFVELRGGTAVPARSMSEGLLYYLAYVALPYLKPASLLLVEEPENGLHPSRVAEVVRILRKLSETGTQVLIATHSPLVLNELKPEEVSVVTRAPELWSRVRPIKEMPNFENRMKTFALGELWVSYANGIDEAPLFDQQPGTQGDSV